MASSGHLNLQSTEIPGLTPPAGSGLLFFASQKRCVPDWALSVAMSEF